MKLVIRANTQELWDEVMNYLVEEKVREKYYNAWNKYGSKTCISILDGTFCEDEYFIEKGYKILRWEVR